MSDKRLEVTCPRCGHTWHLDLSRLAKPDQVIYKGKVQRKTYRTRCSQCSTYVVFTVEVEEAEDG